MSTCSWLRAARHVRNGRGYPYPLTLNDCFWLLLFQIEPPVQSYEAQRVEPSQVVSFFFLTPTLFCCVRSSRSSSTFTRVDSSRWAVAIDNVHSAIQTCIPNERQIHKAMREELLAAQANFVTCSLCRNFTVWVAAHSSQNWSNYSMISYWAAIS